MLGYFLCVLGGFLFGVVLTCILLAKKNLEAYTAISKGTENSFKNNIAAAKSAYKAYAKDIDASYGLTDTSEQTDDEPETEDTEDE